MISFMILSYLSLVQSKTSFEEQFNILSREKRYLTYPFGSAIGMFLAFAVPLDLPDQDVLFSYNVEANYNLPDNLTYYKLTPDGRSIRDIGRAATYHHIQHRLDSVGYNGRECLLRSICEVASEPILHNGLLGQLLHIILTPSSSADEDLENDFFGAEELGLLGGNCHEVYSCCPHSLLDLFTSLEDDW